MCRPAVAKVSPASAIESWRSRRVRRVVGAPSRCSCHARRTIEGVGRHHVRRRVPAVEGLVTEQGQSVNEALRRWAALKKDPVAEYYWFPSMTKATGDLVRVCGGLYLVAGGAAEAE